MLEPFGEFGANSHQKLSFQTRFVRLDNKKSSPQNQCEKHKIDKLNNILY